jgi:hypothetical protein
MRLANMMPVCCVLLAPLGGTREDKTYNFRSSEAYEALTDQERQALEQVHRDFVLLWGALDMFAQDHSGQVPKSLKELAPLYLKELPKDPFATSATATEKVSHYTVSLDGWGYRYFPGVGNAFVVSSVGLPRFPYLARTGNVGLYRAKGIWSSGEQFVGSSSD